MACLEKYAECYEQIATVCKEALPKLKSVVKIWHKEQCKRTKKCETRKICGAKKGVKPSAASGFCKNCISWSEAIEGVYFDPGGSQTSIEWNTVNASQFHHDNFEVVKVFVHYKECRNVSKFTDFTAMDILRVLMHCGLFHKSQEFYKTLKDALDMLISFDRQLKDDCSDDHCNRCFNVADKLVNCLLQLEVIPDVKPYYKKMELTNKTVATINIIQTIYETVSKTSAPFLKDFIEWHQEMKESTSPCTTPKVCSKLIRRSFCQSCAKWVEVIESAAESVDALQWSNANPSRFYHNYVEVMKVFAHRLPNDVTVSVFDEFHAADTLKIMSQFVIFNSKKPELHECIVNVYNVAILHTKLGYEVTVDESIAETMKSYVKELSRMFPKTITDVERQELVNNIDKVFQPQCIVKGKFYDIEGKHVELIKPISKSGCGTTWEAQLSINGSSKIDVIAKKVKSIDMETVHLLRDLDHPNLLKYYGTIQEGGADFVITETAAKGNLQSYLDRRNVGFLSSALYRKWLTQACEVVKYLQEKRLVHKDIRSSHFYITEDNNLKLGDFYLVKEMEQTKSTCARSSCRWMAPEVVKDQIRSPKSDIFSLGMVIWEIGSKQIPFKDLKGDYAVMNALVDGKQPPVPSECKQMKTVLTKCWDINHSKRPSVDYILQNVDAMVQEYASLHNKTDPQSRADQGERVPSMDTVKDAVKDGHRTNKPIADIHDAETSVDDYHDHETDSASGASTKDVDKTRKAVGDVLGAESSVGHHDHETDSALSASIQVADQDEIHHRLDVDVDYTEIAQSVSNVHKFIIAVLNSHQKGAINLVNKTHEPGAAKEAFNDRLCAMLEARQLSKNCIISGTSADDIHQITVAPVQTLHHILASSHAYTCESNTSGTSKEILDTGELVALFTLRSQRKLQSLPEEFAYKQSIQVSESEAGSYKFIDSCEREFAECFDADSVATQVSAFANTQGGQIYFGIDDDGIVNGVAHTENKQYITSTVDMTMKQMIWLKAEQGSIEPQENNQWRIRFIDVVGAPHGSRRRIIVLTISVFQNGHVYCREPQCPVLDPKAERGYRLLSFPEWSSYLQSVHIQNRKTPSGEAATTHEQAAHSSDEESLETDGCIARPAAVLVPPETSLPTSGTKPKQHISRNTTAIQTSLEDAQVSDPSLDQAKAYRIAKKEYKQKTYSVPKEAPSDVQLGFTSAPTSEGLHFASGQRAGALSVKSKLKGDIYSDVAVRVKNYTGLIHIIACLVSEEDKHCLHPNRLVGSNCQRGVFSKQIHIESSAQPIRLANVHITKVERKDVQSELEQRKAYIQRIFPNTALYITKAEEYDLSRVQLCVLGYLPDDTNPDKLTVPLHPITSISLCDKGSSIGREPRILRISETKGPVKGGQKIKLVLARTQDDYDVLFSLNITDPPSSWQTIAEVSESILQKSTRIATVRVPAYHKKDITSPTQVKVQVRSNGLYSNAVAYSYLPSIDKSVDIKKKVDKRRPVYITHFTDVGAARPDVLEYDEKESRMGLSKRKWKPSTNEDAPHSTENLLAVTKRLPTVIPARPLPKPKQTGSGATPRAQQSKDMSDGASSSETSEMLRKYKAFASTHGYKKTAQRVEDVKTHYMDSVAEEEQLPPAEEETKELYVSDWVTSTLPATKKKPEEVTPENEAQKKADDAEMKAIALGIDQTSTAKSEDPAIKVQGPDQAGGAHVMEQSSTDGSYNTASGDDKKDEYVNNWVTSTMMQGTEDSQKGAAAQGVEEKTGEKQEMEQLQVAEQGSSDGSFKTADSESGSEQMIAEYKRQLQEQDDSDVDSNAPTGDRSSSSGTMSMNGDQTDGTGLDGKANNEEASAEEPATLFQQGSEGSDVLLNNVEWGEVLGKGNYGRVHRVVWNGKPGVATKSTTGNNVRKLKQLNNPHIVATFGLYYWSAESAEPQEPYIVTEYMQQGSLKQALRDAPKLTLRRRMYFALQAAHGFAFLHSKGIAHGDVGTQNCFLQEEDKLKVQMLELHDEKSKSADVEMFGNLLVEVVFAHETYETQTGAGSRPEIPRRCPADLRELIQSCWNESAMQSLTDVDGKLDRLISKWLSKDGWKDFEDLDELECDVHGTSDENLHSGPTIKITSTRDASSASSSAVHISDQSQYPMKAIADLIVSGNSTPESGTFDAESPFYGQSPNTTQQPEHLKNTMTSDYNSPNSTRLFKEQEIEHVSAALGNQELRLTDQDEHEDGSANLDKTRQLGEEPEAQNIYDHPISERKYQSPPAETSSPPMNTSEHLSMDNSQFVGARETQQKARRVKLTPPRVTKEVGANGDTLTLEDLGIEMHIPPGALEQIVPITLTVVWDDDFPRPQLGKEDCNVCPVVRCLPSGLHFLKPVKIRIPHCAVIPSDKEKVNANVHWNENDEGQAPDWQTNAEAEVEVNDDHLLLSMTHFSDPYVTLGGIEWKKMKLLADITEMEQVHQEVHVYVHNDHPEALKQVKEEQKVLGNRKRNGLSPRYLLLKSGKDMTVELKIHKMSRWVIQSEFRKVLDRMNLWYFDVSSCQFNLERVSEEDRLMCVVQAGQEGNPRQKAELEIAQACQCPQPEAAAAPQQFQQGSPAHLHTVPPAATAQQHLQGSTEPQAEAAQQQFQRPSECQSTVPLAAAAQQQNQRYQEHHSIASPATTGQQQCQRPPEQLSIATPGSIVQPHLQGSQEHQAAPAQQQLQRPQELQAPATQQILRQPPAGMPLQHFQEYPERQGVAAQLRLQTSQQPPVTPAATTQQQSQGSPEQQTPTTPQHVVMKQQLRAQITQAGAAGYQTQSVERTTHQEMFIGPTQNNFEVCNSQGEMGLNTPRRGSDARDSGHMSNNSGQLQQWYAQPDPQPPRQPIQSPLHPYWLQTTPQSYMKPWQFQPLDPYQCWRPIQVPANHSFHQRSLSYTPHVTGMGDGPWLPLDIEVCVCNKLDVEEKYGKDYRMLASNFELDHNLFEREKSPTKAILEHLKSQNRVRNLNDLKDALEQIPRPDLVEYIDEYLTKHPGHKNQQRPYHSLPSTPAVGGGIPAIEGGMQGNQQAIATDLVASDLDSQQMIDTLQGSPPGAGNLTRIPMMASPPAATTPRESPDTPWLPLDIEVFVCKKLDVEDKLGKDYRMLASNFELDHNLVEREKSPTKAILEHLKSQNRVRNLNDLKDALEQIPRPDLVEYIDKYLTKHPGHKNQQRPYHSLPSTPAVGGGIPAIEGGMQGYQQAIATDLVASDLDSQQMIDTLQGSPPGAGNLTRIPMMASPPAATTPRESPDTPGSGQATIPGESAAIIHGAAASTQTGNDRDDVANDLQAYGVPKSQTNKRVRRNSGEE